MTQIFHSMIAAILGISEKQIGQTLSLLDDGATIPFISRYRKEMTGGLDEVQIIHPYPLRKTEGNGETEGDHRRHHPRTGENDPGTAKAH